MVFIRLVSSSPASAFPMQESQKIEKSMPLPHMFCFAFV